MLRLELALRLRLPLLSSKSGVSAVMLTYRYTMYVHVWWRVTMCLYLKEVYPSPGQGGARGGRYTPHHGRVGPEEVDNVWLCSCIKLISPFSMQFLHSERLLSCLPVSCILVVSCSCYLKLTSSGIQIVGDHRKMQLQESRFCVIYLCPRLFKRNQ